MGTAFSAGLPLYFFLALFWLILLLDVYLVRVQISSEEYRSMKHEHWDYVSVRRAMLAFYSVILSFITFLALSLFGLAFFLVSLGIGIGIALTILSLTRH